MKNMEIKYPNRLRELRLKAGFTQRQVSAALGFNSEERISRWEQGQSMPSYPNIVKLIKLYKTFHDEIYSKLL